MSWRTPFTLAWDNRGSVVLGLGGILIAVLVITRPISIQTSTFSAEGLAGPDCLDWTFRNTDNQGLADFNAIGNPGNILHPGNPAVLDAFGQVTNNCDVPAHLLFRAKRSDQAGGEPRNLEHDDVNGFTRYDDGNYRIDVPNNGQTYKWKITYDTASYACGRILANAAWRMDGVSDFGGFAVVLNYGQNCGGATHTPTPSAPPIGGPLPTPNHPIDLGYYFTDGKYGDVRNEVACYTNVHRAARFDYGTDLTPSQWLAKMDQAMRDTVATQAQKIYLGLDLVAVPEQLGAILDAAKPYWSRVGALELADEPDWDQATTATMVQRVRTEVQSRGLTVPPIGIVYARSQILNGSAYRAAGLDWVGVEAYVDPPGSNTSSVNVADLNNYLSQAKSKIPSDKKIVFVMQAYARNGLWTNISTLTDLQKVPYLQAYNDPRVIGILMFSYGRPSGTREHSELKVVHQEIGQKLFGSSLCGSPSASPTPTPTGSSGPTPSVTRTPTPTGTPVCRQRPACLDAQPACLIPEPAEGWCPISLSVVDTSVPVVCAPQYQAVAVGDLTTVTAQGGTGIYQWSSVGTTPSTGSSSVFQTVVNDIAAHQVTVTSGAQAAVCIVDTSGGQADVVPAVPQLDMTIRNITRGTASGAQGTTAQENDILEVTTVVRNTGDGSLDNARVLFGNLPAQLTRESNTSPLDVALGDIPAQSSRTVQTRLRAGSFSTLPFGSSSLRWGATLTNASGAATVQDSVVVQVVRPAETVGTVSGGTLSIQLSLLGKNITQRSALASQVAGQPNDTIELQAVVTSTASQVVNDSDFALTFPTPITPDVTVSINGRNQTQTVQNQRISIDLGALSPGQSVTIKVQGHIATADQFSRGDTVLVIDTQIQATGLQPIIAQLPVRVTYAGLAGVSQVPTGAATTTQIAFVLAVLIAAGYVAYTQTHWFRHRELRRSVES